ncbi:hypothetical protein MBANPS3_006643 [Mucor bainieri]
MAIVTSPGDMEEYRRPEASSSSSQNESEPSMRTMLLEMEEHSTFPQSCKKCKEKDISCACIEKSNDV